MEENEVKNIVKEMLENVTYDYNTKRAFEKAIYEIIADNRDIQGLIKNIILENIRRDYEIRDEIKRIIKE